MNISEYVAEEMPIIYLYEIILYKWIHYFRYLASTKKDYFWKFH